MKPPGNKHILLEKKKFIMLIEILDRVNVDRSVRKIVVVGSKSKVTL